MFKTEFSSTIGLFWDKVEPGNRNLGPMQTSAETEQRENYCRKVTNRNDRGQNKREIDHGGDKDKSQEGWKRAREAGFVFINDYLLMLVVGRFGQY